MTLVCGRCDLEAAPPVVRETIANREREARQDGRPFVHPAYAIEPRCADVEACRERVRQQGDAA